MDDKVGVASNRKHNQNVHSRFWKILGPILRYLWSFRWVRDPDLRQPVRWSFLVHVVVLMLLIFGLPEWHQEPVGDVIGVDFVFEDAKDPLPVVLKQQEKLQEEKQEKPTTPPPPKQTETTPPQPPKPQEEKPQETKPEPEKMDPPKPEPKKPDPLPEVAKNQPDHPDAPVVPPKPKIAPPPPKAPVEKAEKNTKEAKVAEKKPQQDPKKKSELDQLLDRYSNQDTQDLAHKPSNQDVPSNSKSPIKDAPVKKGGTSEGALDPLKMSVRDQIKKHWEYAPSFQNKNIVIKLVFSLTKTGELVEIKSIKATGNSDVGQDILALVEGTAHRAVTNAVPFKLPVEQYSDWNEIDATFRVDDLNM